METPEQVARKQKTMAEWAIAQKNILPAKLADTAANGNLVSAWMRNHKLPPTASNFYSCLLAIYAELEWTVKPKILLRDEQNASIYKIKPTQDAQDVFAEKVKAGEAADAQKELDKASIKQAKSLIGSYLPIRSTPRGDVVDYTEQSKMQTEWTAALNQAIEGKKNLQAFTTRLATEMREKYEARERAKERV